jgi:methionine synthase I (cobalamin-dependent)
MDFLETLSKRVVLADPDARLAAAAPDFVGCIEQLCAADPDRLAAVHRAAIEAGAEVLRTASLEANAHLLKRWGLERHVGEYNWLAAQIARSAARGTEAIVAARVGPSGAAFSEIPMPELRELFLWQIGSLLDGGAQIVIFEGFHDLRELALALEMKQTLHHCPAIACLPGPGRFLPGELSLDAALGRALDAGADVVGLAGAPLTEIACLAEGCAYPPLAAFASISGSPEAFASGAAQLAQLGIHLIGGGAGITAGHIAAAAAVLHPPEAAAS